MVDGSYRSKPSCDICEHKQDAMIKKGHNWSVINLSATCYHSNPLSKLHCARLPVQITVRQAWATLIRVVTIQPLASQSTQMKLYSTKFLRGKIFADRLLANFQENKFYGLRIPLATLVFSGHMHSLCSQLQQHHARLLASKPKHFLQ